MASLGVVVGLTRSQVLALALFSSMVLGTLFFWVSRLIFAFLAVGVLLALGLLDVAHLIEFANLDVILFLVGMMLVVGYLEERGFFEGVLEVVMDRMGHNTTRLTVLMMAIAALSAALVDEVTSILFIMAVGFRIVSRFGLKPAPYLMMMVFATNVGSSATVVGNPIGVIIALRGGLTFADFLRWATPITFLFVLPVTILLSLLIFRRDIVPTIRSNHRPEQVGLFTARYRTSWILFGATILGLVLHSTIEHLLGLNKNTMLLGTALLAGGVALLLSGTKARELVEKKVDWWTLAFFIFLFVSVGTLKFVGITDVVAGWIQAASGGSPNLAFILITAANGFLTAFLDNVLAVATFIPVVQSLGTTMDNFPLWWGMLFGGTLGGNATIIGSTANIVAIGMMERQGKGHIGFVQWLIPGVIVSVITLGMAAGLLLLQMAVFR